MALAGCRVAVPGRARGPAFSAVTFSIDGAGGVSVDAAPGLVTTLGRFDLAADAPASLPVDGRSTLVVIRHLQDRAVVGSAYRINAPEELAVRVDDEAPERVAGRRAFVDASETPARTVTLDLAGPGLPSGAVATARPIARVAGALSGTWKGTYTCTQGATGLTLVVAAGKGLATATFSFYPVAANPGVPRGRFAMTGTYTSRSLDLEPDHWIARP